MSVLVWQRTPRSCSLSAAATSPQGGGTQAEGCGGSPWKPASDVLDSSPGVSSVASWGAAESGELCGAAGPQTWNETLATLTTYIGEASHDLTFRDSVRIAVKQIEQTV